MKFSVFTFVVGVFISALVPVKAVEVDNLYTGKILVTDRTQKTRVKAHRWAIEQVITKVTGSRDILTNRTIANEVRLRTANYIKSFTFVVDEQERTFLVDEFDQLKIDKLLRQVGASIWGQRRPQTLVWLVVEEGLERKIVDEETVPQIAEMILQSSDNRGLPVILPNVSSSEDIFSSDVWAKFDNVVAQASQPYNVDHFVMARLYYSNNEQNEGWVLDYQLMDGRDVLLSAQYIGEQFSVMRSMIDEMADYFASQYSIKSEALGIKKVSVSVQGVDDVIDAIKVEGFLKNLPPVAKVTMLKLAGKIAFFELHLSGQALDVVKAIDLLDEFKRVEQEALPEPELTVEEQLEQLRQSYLNEQEKEQENDEPSFSNLVYRWLG